MKSVGQRLNGYTFTLEQQGMLDCSTSEVVEKVANVTVEE